MTVPEDREKQSRARLLSLLEAYGADTGRWPADEREAHARALADEALAGPVREARALDLLLDRASAPVAGAGAAARLLARVASEARAGNVIDFAAGRPVPRRSGPRIPVAALSALAASLVLGLYLGASGLTDDLLPSDGAGETPEFAQLGDFDVLGGTLGFLAEQEES